LVHATVWARRIIRGIVEDNVRAVEEETYVSFSCSKTRRYSF
jgi:hypothetical protein